ncbi:MAG: DNA polymerase III subunit delta [Xanthomonadales bacterium]|nr:DNA polymerase III subunit delta [Xanthomonadales bacterium]
MQLKAEQLAGSLEQGLAPVYLVGGEEPLLLQECCDQIKAAAKAQGFLERELLHVGQGFDWSELQSVAAPSLFGSRKIIDLRLPTGKPGREGGAILTKWAEDPDPEILLLVSCEKWDAGSRKSKWASKLAKAGVQIDIWPIAASQLPSWLQQRMQRQGMQPETDALRILADRLEGNLLAANQEVDRLALLKGPGPITAEDVLQAVADSSRFDAFVLSEHMLTGNLKEGLRVAAGLKRIGTPLPPLLGALLKELKTTEAFRLAMRAGEPETTAFRRLNIWYKKQGIIRSAARRLDTRKLFEAFKILALVDRQSKGRAAGDPWRSIDELLLQLSVR